MPGACWAGSLPSWCRQGSCSRCSWEGGPPGRDVGSGQLHILWQQATTMTFLGIVACQLGTAMAACTQTVSLARIGFLSNRLLLGGIAFEVAFSAAIVGIAPLQLIFGTAVPAPSQLLMLLPFPFIVWGSDEVFKWFLRRRNRPSWEQSGGVVNAAMPGRRGGVPSSAGHAKR
ncbi:MAG: cation-translocating P-type ATPase C-terminal domain-containing protein [Specibacter sp.]